MSQYTPRLTIKKRGKKGESSRINVVHATITALVAGGSVTLLYFYYNTTKKLRNSLSQATLLAEQRDLVQAERNSMKEEQDLLQEARNQQQEENNNLKQQRDQLEEEKKKLQQEKDGLQRENPTLGQTSLSLFDENIDAKKLEKLHHQDRVKEAHEKTGCQKDDFERWLHNSKKANVYPGTGEFVSEDHFSILLCDVCRKKIYTSYLANGIVNYHCTNYEAHKKEGGFHVCRSCATGKEGRPCSRCGVDYVKIFPYEKENLCLICVGYDTQLAAFKEIIKAAGLTFPEMLTVFPDPNKTPKKVVTQISCSEYQSKKMNDPYVVEEVVAQIDRYSQRYAYPGSPIATLTQKELKSILKQYKSGDQEYQRIFDLLSESDTEVTIMSTPAFRTYSWEYNGRSVNHYPKSRQSLKLFLIKYREETYLVLEDTCFLSCLESSL